MSKTTELICRECGQPIGLHYMEPVRSRLKFHQLCFSCYFWFNIAEELRIMSATEEERSKFTKEEQKTYRLLSDRVKAIIVEDDYTVLYAHKDEKTTSKFKGFAGRHFNFTLKDGRKVSSDNVWYRGTVPEHYRDRICPNLKENKK